MPAAFNTAQYRMQAAGFTPLQAVEILFKTVHLSMVVLSNKETIINYGKAISGFSQEQNLDIDLLSCTDEELDIQK